MFEEDSAYAVNSLIDDNSSHRIFYNSPSESVITSEKKTISMDSINEETTIRKRERHRIRLLLSSAGCLVTVYFWWEFCYRSGPNFVNPIRSDPIRSGPVRSGPVRSCPGFANGHLNRYEILILQLFAWNRDEIIVPQFGMKRYVFSNKYMAD